MKLLFTLVMAQVAFMAPANAKIQVLSAKGDQQQQTQLRGSSTKYDHLKRQFDLARRPSESEILGWSTGRCFFQNSPDTPKANLLVGVTKNANKDSGPGFPTKNVTKIVSIEYSSQSADVFDHLTPEEEAEVTSIVDQSFESTTEMIKVKGSLSSTNTPGNLEYRVRANDQYIYMRAILTIDNGSLKKGDAYASCYYFAKVK